MLELTTLKIFNRHFSSVLKGLEKYPKKYTYMMESLKQIKHAMILDFWMNNKQLYN